MVLIWESLVVGPERLLLPSLQTRATIRYELLIQEFDIFPRQLFAISFVVLARPLFDLEFLLKLIHVA